MDLRRGIALLQIFNTLFQMQQVDLGEIGMDKVETSVGYIHIRNQQRNGRKSITTIQGIPERFSLQKMIKFFTKEFNCNGTIVDDPQHGKIVQLQGDKRKEVADFLHHQGIAEREQIKVHGA